MADLSIEAAPTSPKSNNENLLRNAHALAFVAPRVPGPVCDSRAAVGCSRTLTGEDGLVSWVSTGQSEGLHHP